jgi:hypothetical protein
MGSAGLAQGIQTMKRTVGAAALILIMAGSALSCLPAVAAGPAALKADQIQIAYLPPKNPEHRPIYEIVQERRILERFKDYLEPLQLPGPLLLKIDGCDGESNAWYEESEHAVTICYEYLAEILSNAPKETTPSGVTRQDALVGPVVEVFLHEIAHAIFDMLNVPILGREEDAADQVASYLLLRFEKNEARSTVIGVAYMYGKEAQSQTPGLKQFANVHGLPAQRFYNLLCMAYGADPQLFGDLVQKGYLPETRAEGCEDEYRQIDFAVRKLIMPYIDQKLKNDPARKKKLLKPAGQP